MFTPIEKAALKILGRHRKMYIREIAERLMKSRVGKASTSGDMNNYTATVLRRIDYKLKAAKRKERIHNDGGFGRQGRIVWRGPRQ